MIVLIDNDILIDVALNRIPYAAPAGQLLEAVERRDITGFVAWHTIANFYYLVQPKHGSEGAKDFILDLLQFVEVARASTQDVRYAASLPMRDFEDAMQAAAAVACRATVIATRNIRDYKRAPVRAVTPARLLQE